MPREKPPKPEELIERLEEKVVNFMNKNIIINLTNLINHITIINKNIIINLITITIVIIIIERLEEKVLNFILNKNIIINLITIIGCWRRRCSTSY